MFAGHRQGFWYLHLGIRAYVGSTPVTTDNAWKVASMHFGNASAADSIVHIVCFSPKNEKCLGEEATHHLFLFLAVSGVSVWVTQHCWLPLHCWAGQCLWGSSGQHWTTVRWLLLFFVFCFFLFVCYSLCEQAYCYRYLSLSVLCWLLFRCSWT